MQDDPQVIVALEESDRTGLRVLGLRIPIYAFGLLSSILITRALGPHGRGLYALSVAYLGTVMVLCHLGLEHANVYLAARGTRLGRLWWNSTVASLLIGVIAWILLAALYGVSSGDVFGSIPGAWMVVVAAQVPFLLATLYWTGVLQLAGHLRRAVLAFLAGATLQAAGSAALFATGRLTPFSALLLLWVTNGTTWLVLLAWSLRMGLTRDTPHWPTLRRAVAFGVRASLALVLVFLLLRVDQVMVQRILGFRELGLYSLAVVLAELIWLFTDPFAAALLPHQVRLGGGGERRLGYATARLGLTIAILAAVAGWLLAPYAIPVVFGSAYAGAVWPFRLLLPGAVAFAIQRPLAQVLLKEGRLTAITLCNVGALAVNVVANLILLPAVGIGGASVASTVTYVAVAAAYVQLTREPGVADWPDLRPRLAELGRLLRGIR